MSEAKEKAGIDRRRFLMGAGAGATAVGATQLATASPAYAVDPGPEESRARYQLSEEVKTFYRVNGYEGRK